MASDNNGLAIDLHDVRKTFRGKVHALRGIDMQAKRGEIFGLLGPNGAGKSTLVKIMLSVIRPTHAKGTVLGDPVGRKSTLRRVGYLPEKHRFPEYLTGRQAVEFTGAMTKVDRRTRKMRASELLELVGMKDWASKKLGTYSKGMQQRVGIAAAMVNSPDLIVLDEPTDGVDPLGRRDIRDILVEIRKRGSSVFLNSHLLSELEMVCDRVAILVQGQVAAQGTIDELTADSQRYEIRITGAAPTWAKEAGLNTRDYPDSSDTLMVARTAEAEDVQGTLDRLRGEGRTIVSVQPVRESLEDLFMRYVKDPLTGKSFSPGAVTGKHRSAPPVFEGGSK
jgi:ABC-2 type transport system ATP-binding protein